MRGEANALTLTSVCLWVDLLWLGFGTKSRHVLCRRLTNER